MRCKYVDTYKVYLICGDYANKYTYNQFLKIYLKMWCLHFEQLRGFDRKYDIVYLK